MTKKLFPLIISAILILFSSCSKDEKDFMPELESELSEYELSMIDYFKEIALGFEFGSASEITRKWKSEMKIFVGGEPTPDLLEELENIKNEINDLATDGFKMVVVNDSIQSNFYLFFGTGEEYAKINPSQSNYVASNWGLFSIFWENGNQLNSGLMYVDIERANLTEQKHLLREELTQSLGLAKDSPQYQESIFQSSWTTTNDFAEIDKDLIRLLYHPDMTEGLNRSQVDEALRDILENE